MELVSIIIPVYNVEKTITRCLESVLNQTYKNIEIIIINDGSKDRSGEICDKYSKLDRRVKVIHISNNGVSNARNIGIKNSGGKYIQFVDSDDWIESNMVEGLIKIKGKAKLAVCGYVYEGKNIVREIDFKYLKNGSEYLAKDFLKLYESCLLNSPCNKLYDAQIIKNNKIIFKKEIDLGEDLIFNLEYLREIDKFVVSKQHYYHYMDNNDTTLTKKFRENAESVQQRLFNEIYNTAVKLNAITSYNRELLYSIYYNMMWDSIINYFGNECNYGELKRYKKVSEIFKSINVYNIKPKSKNIFLMQKKLFNLTYILLKIRSFKDRKISQLQK